MLFCFKPLRTLHTLFPRISLDLVHLSSFSRSFILWLTMWFLFPEYNAGSLCAFQASVNNITLLLQPSQTRRPDPLWRAPLTLRAWPPLTPIALHCRTPQTPEISPFLSHSSGTVHSSLKTQWSMNPCTVWNPSGIKHSYSLSIMILRT